MLKLLLVDDEYFVREALKTIFSELEGVHVVGEVTFGGKVLEFVNRSKPNIVFLDTNIPGVEAPNLIKQMKASNENLKIILLIDFRLLDHVEKLIEIGADEYIVKPINRQSLITLIDRFLPLHSTFVENIQQTAEPRLLSLNTNDYKKEIQAALEYIEDHFQKGVTLEEVAEHVHLSPFYLSKLFKKDLNINFVNYVKERKIQKAKELLEQTNLPVLNIALELNYQEGNYFSKVFKKMTGMTPSEYRKEFGLEKGTSTIFKRHFSIQNGNWHV